MLGTMTRPLGGRRDAGGWTSALARGARPAGLYNSSDHTISSEVPVKMTGQSR